jgi:hypothetical protein
VADYHIEAERLKKLGDMGIDRIVEGRVGLEEKINLDPVEKHGAVLGLDLSVDVDQAEVFVAT